MGYVNSCMESLAVIFNGINTVVSCTYILLEDNDNIYKRSTTTQQGK